MRLGIMESVECGIREKECRINKEIPCLSPASTSYGGLSSSEGEDDCSPSISFYGGTDREVHRKKLKGPYSPDLKIRAREKITHAPPREGKGDRDGDMDNVSNLKTFERLVQRSELEEEVLLLHKRLAEELELRVVLESAMGHLSGTMTSFPGHLPIAVQEVLADITMLEVAVSKLDEQTTTLRGQLGQARTEREIAELRHSSKHSMESKWQRESRLFPILADPSKGPEEDQPTRPRLKSSASRKQREKVVAPTLVKNTEQLLHPDESLLSSCRGQDTEILQALHSRKEPRVHRLRDDLRLTIPEVVDDDHVSPSPWQTHQHSWIAETQKRQPFSPWRHHNPLEDEEHWRTTFNAQRSFAESGQDVPEETQSDPRLLSVGLVAKEENLPHIPSAFAAEYLHLRSPSLAWKQDDPRSLIPVAEVLWKPDTCGKPSAELLRMPLSAAAGQPEIWSFVTEDGYPLPESVSVPQSMTFEDQPCSKPPHMPSVDELKMQRSKYRVDVMKVRQQRRHGNKAKDSDKLQAMNSSETCSLSSVQSDVLLSPESPPLDMRTEAEKCWDSQEKISSHEASRLYQTPNELSEKMVRCMINIYCHLVDASSTTKGSSPSGNSQSPTSPFGAFSNSSASSLSESSMLSMARSPLVDRRSKEVWGTDSTPDPFKARDKVPWADIGSYAHVFEVPSLSVDKDQLEYAALALRNFKLLVEQLSRVDPSKLKHDEKLAFWINLYNALLMHAYLAYGIPRSDHKFFSLMQKAAYNVGGHSFSAAAVEYCILKSKSTSHRSQLALLAHHKNKINEEQNKFGIDRSEPLVSFALCSGTRSSPMVRVYKPTNVHSQLQDALHDYTRASVGLSTKGRLIVPKLLYSFAREFVEDAGLLDWICNLLPSKQVAVIFECIHQHRHRFLSSRNFSIIPYNFSFRYLFPLEVGQNIVY